MAVALLMGCAQARRDGTSGDADAADVDAEMDAAPSPDPQVAPLAIEAAPPLASAAPCAEHAGPARRTAKPAPKRPLRTPGRDSSGTADREPARARTQHRGQDKAKKRDPTEDSYLRVRSPTPGSWYERHR
jgi:hypothetical protein